MHSPIQESCLIITVESVVWMGGKGIVIEGPAVPEGTESFWIELGPGLGYVEFRAVEGCRTTFQAKKSHPATYRVPGLRVSLRHVLWRRQAAIEAERGISAYRAAADRLPGSSIRSGI
ncbi:hypothetical protein D3C86_1648400 [compost metagenome]